jgi:hypothetical protein
MKLLGNTILLHDQEPVSYEILLIGQMLVFKPFFYHVEEEFPCIVLIQYATGWQFQNKINIQLEKQIWQDIAGLEGGVKIVSWQANDQQLNKETSLKRA